MLAEIHRHLKNETKMETISLRLMFRQKPSDIQGKSGKIPLSQNDSNCQSRIFKCIRGHWRGIENLKLRDWGEGRGAIQKSLVGLTCDSDLIGD